MTVVGDIVFDRQKLCCLSCGKESYPLDEGLDIAERRLVAPGLRERALWLATEMAYEKSAEGLQKLCGITISEGTIKNLVLEEGSEVLRQKEQERKRVWEQGGDVTSGDGKKRVFVQVDGTGVNDRSTKGWFEAKVGVIFSETKKVSKDRVEILDKRTYATTEDVSAFREHFVIEAGRGEVGELLMRLGKLQAYSRDPTFRAKLGELISYISKNKDGIENASKMDFYGSGPIEKAVDVTICRRFKKGGMSWFVHKANPLLALRLLKLNGEWEAYWRQKGLVTV